MEELIPLVLMNVLKKEGFLVLALSFMECHIISKFILISNVICSIDAGPPSPANHLREVFYRMGLDDKVNCASIFILLEDNL